jgi:hypothetical protein
MGQDVFDRPRAGNRGMGQLLSGQRGEELLQCDLFFLNGLLGQDIGFFDFIWQGQAIRFNHIHQSNQ